MGSFRFLRHRLHRPQSAHHPSEEVWAIRYQQGAYPGCVPISLLIFQKLTNAMYPRASLVRRSPWVLQPAHEPPWRRHAIRSWRCVPSWVQWIRDATTDVCGRSLGYHPTWTQRRSPNCYPGVTPNYDSILRFSCTTTSTPSGI